MPFCPNCRFEYKEGIEVCPDCGTDLVEELPEEAGPLETVEFVLLKDLPSRLYAEMLKGALEKEGIACVVKGDDVGSMLGTYATTSPFSVTVWVDRNKLFKAKSIAQQILGDI